MVEQSQTDRKSQLIAELERSRSELARGLRGVRYDVSLAPHLKHAFVRHKSLWLLGAAAAGWVLSRLPAHSKKTSKKNGAALLDRSPKKQKESERAGIALAIVGVLGTLFKPAIKAFATRQITEFVKKNIETPFSRSHARR